MQILPALAMGLAGVSVDASMRSTGTRGGQGLLRRWETSAARLSQMARVVPEGLWLLGLLGAFWLLLMASVREKSATADEPLHATGGYTYWQLGDYRVQVENSGNGVLSQRWFALPLLTGVYPFPPPTAPGWSEANGFLLGDVWFHRMGNDTLAMLTRGRAMAALVAVMVAALIWGCARRLFGAAAGWLALILCILNPTLLANGPLMASDTTAALFFLAASWAWWTMLHQVTWGRVLLSSLTLAGLFVAKASAPAIVPCLVLLMLWRVIRGGPLRVGGSRHYAARGPQIVWFGAIAMMHALIVYVTIWGFYGFRYACCADADSEATTASRLWSDLTRKSLVDAVDELPLPNNTARAARAIIDRFAVSVDASSESTAEVVQALKTTVLTPAQGALLDAAIGSPVLRSSTARVILWTRQHELLPEAYLMAYLHMWHHSRSRRSFLNGEFSSYGSRWFFPFTFLVKTPLPTFGLMVLAAAAWARRRDALAPPGGLGSLAYRSMPLLILVAVYLAVALAMRLNIGHRHLLPIYPPLLVLCGGAAAWCTAGARREARGGAWAGLAVILLVGLQAAEMAYRFPHYLAYFNGIVRPAQAYRHLVDGSLDWGQDLPGVRRYIDRHAAAGPFYLSYFGAGSPVTYGIAARYLPSTPGLFASERPPLSRVSLAAGDTPETIDAKYPDYERVGQESGPDGTRAVLVKRPEELRLAAGTYFIGATMLQTPWDDRAEANYQRLRAVVEPFLASDAATRRANLARAGTDRWAEALRSWEIARFARLTVFLRQREPDAHVGFSILVFQLTNADVEQALGDARAPSTTAR